MSKPIYMTPSMKADILMEFTQQLDQMNFLDGKIKYETAYYWPPDKDENGHEIPDQVTVHFSKQAQSKQEALIRGFSSEVGWHGVARRDENDPKLFYVEDILVFPQQVTGSTVVPEQGEYDKWLMDLPMDQFDRCRYHGHSHVNMATRPSPTDDRFQMDTIKKVRGDGLPPEEQEAFLEQLGDSAFYIFMIWNKEGEVNASVFDVANNSYYSGKDVVIEYEDQPDLRAFMEEAKQKVVPRTYQPKSKNVPYSYFGYDVDPDEMN